MTDTLSPAQEAQMMLQSALSYHRRGWVPIPVLRGEQKKPAIKWACYQQQHPTEAEIRRWFTPHHRNVGIVTGEISGFFALDIDGKEGFDTIRAMGGVPKTIVTKSREWRGQCWFRHPGHKVSNAVKFLPGLDLRGDGGYVQSPPSKHSSGSRYKWLLSPDEAELAQAPNWLLEHTVKREIEPSPLPDTALFKSEHSGTREQKYLMAKLAGKCQDLAAAPDGEKYARLRSCAIDLAGFLHYGAFTRDDIKQNLFNVIAGRAKDKALAMNGLESAIAYGEVRPRMIDLKETR